jgi:hypothetical protein
MSMTTVSSWLRSVAAVLCFVLVANAVGYAAPALDVASIRQALQTRGVGNAVKIKRTDGVELAGRIQLIGEDAVTIQTSRTAAPVVVIFSDISEVKKPGMSRGAKIGLAIAIPVAVVAIVAIVLVHEFHSTFPKQII